jgi:RNA polymerase sigma-70 factor (ECF subfamily)
VSGESVALLESQGLLPRDRTAVTRQVPLAEADEPDLVARAQRGDRDAFGALVNRHRTAVYRAARTALGSDREADDVAQEACLAAFRQLDHFRCESSFRTWLLTIAWNRAINRRRALNRWWRRLSGNGLAVDGVRPSPDRTPEETAGDLALRAAIKAEIQALSPTLRDTLRLSHTGEYTYEAIGQMLSVPSGTIKWRVAEARRLIRLGLRKRGYNHAG